MNGFNLLANDDMKLFKLVDDELNRAVASGDIQRLLAMGRRFGQGIRIRGVAFAKLLYGMKDNWESFNVDDEFEYVATYDMGIPKSTVYKYTQLWSAVFMNSDISDEVKQLLLDRPMKSLLLLTGLANDSELNPDWNEIAMAGSYQDIRDIVRRLRGKRTSSSSAVYIMMDSVTGQLYAKSGDRPREVFGILTLGKQKEFPEVKSAIERIIREARVGVV